MGAPVTTDDFVRALERAEVKYFAWHLEKLRPERKRRISDLRQQDLMPGGLFACQIRLYRELLEAAVRRRIGFFASESIHLMSISERHFDDFKSLIMTSVAREIRALKDSIERYAQAAGNISKAALPTEHRYVQLEAEILEVVNAEINVLEVERAQPIRAENRQGPPPQQGKIFEPVAAIPSAALWPTPTVLPQTDFPPLRYSLRDTLGDESISKALRLKFCIIVREAQFWLGHTTPSDAVDNWIERLMADNVSTTSEGVRSLLTASESHCRLRAVYELETNRDIEKAARLSKLSRRFKRLRAKFFKGQASRSEDLSAIRRHPVGISLSASPPGDIENREGNREESRGEMVDAFLLRCNELPDLGKKVLRKHIWMAVGHKRPRQFEYWQSLSKRATEEDERNFRRILAMQPEDFIALLKKMGILKPRP